MAGAFEDAGRIFSGGEQDGILNLDWNAAGFVRPHAGSIIIVISESQPGNGREARVSHRMVEAASKVTIATATLARPGKLPVHAQQASTLPGFISTSTSVVGAWERDIMGHMSVQFYASRLSEAEASLALHLGFDPSAASGGILTPTAHRMRFHAELASGDIVVAHSTAQAVGLGGILARTEMREARTGKLAAAFESDLVCLDAATRAHLPLPQTALARLSVFDAAASEPPVWSGSEALDLAAAGQSLVLRREEVVPWEVDHRGEMPPRFFFARMSSSVPFLMAEMGLDRTFMTSGNFGRAAVGYRLRYLRPARTGDCLELRSSIASVGEKSWRFRHVFSEIADGSAVCVVESVVVLFSLADRRAVALPQAIRERAARFQG